VQVGLESSSRQPAVLTEVGEDRIAADTVAGVGYLEVAGLLGIEETFTTRSGKGWRTWHKIDFEVEKAKLEVPVGGGAIKFSTRGYMIEAGSWHVESARFYTVLKNRPMAPGTGLT